MVDAKIDSFFTDTSMVPMTRKGRLVALPVVTRMSLGLRYLREATPSIGCATPVVRTWEAVDKAWTMGDRWITEGEAPQRPIKQTGDLTALLLGLPLSQPGTTAQFAWEVKEGEVEPESISDWYFGTTKGKVPSEEEGR